MKYLKTLGLAAAAVMALTAFGAGAASATTLEDSAGTHPTVIDLSLVNTTKRESTSGSVLDTCTNGTIEGEPTTGGTTETVKVTVAKADLTWSGCTSTTDTTQGGTLEIHHIAGTSNGTVTGTGFEITTNYFGNSCTYGLGTNPVDLGTLKGSDTTPTLEMTVVITEQTEDKFICPNDVVWNMTYRVTTPSGLTVTASPPPPPPSSPTTLEDSNGNHPSMIDASLVGTSTLETTGGSVINTCAGGTIEGIPSTGSATEAVTVPITKEGLTWSGCTSTADTTQGGELEIHHIASTSNGTVTGATFEVTINAFGTSCTYGLSNSGSMAHLSTLKGSDTTPALEINTLVAERTEDKFLCPNDARWTATYHVTTPTGLTVTAG